MIIRKENAMYDRLYMSIEGSYMIRHNMVYISFHVVKQIFICCDYDHNTFLIVLAHK
jgi:hypothetical protein